MKEAWGCDKETTQPQATVPCPICNGAKCESCGQTGRIVYHRCPNALVGAPEQAVLEAYSNLQNGILPCSGGWEDQLWEFVIAMRLLSGLDAEHMEEERRKLEAKQNAAMSRGRAGKR